MIYRETKVSKKAGTTNWGLGGGTEGHPNEMVNP